MSYYIILIGLLILLIIVYVVIKKKQNPNFARVIPTVEDKVGPFSMKVGAVSEVNGVVFATGLIERGRVKLNDTVSVTSGRGIFSSTVSSLKVNDQIVDEASAGEVLTISIANMTKSDISVDDIIYK